MSAVVLPERILLRATGMETLISYTEALELDTRAQKEYYIPAMVLMERAGYECARILLRLLSKKENVSTYPPPTVVFVCGGSNNGGDAQVMARLLHEAMLDSPTTSDQNSDLFSNIRMRVIYCAEPKSPLAKEQRKMLARLGISYSKLSYTKKNDMQQVAKMLSALKASDYIIDGISGVGQKGVFRYPHILDTINKSLAYVISIDVPSGLPPSYDKDAVIVGSDMCITMGFAKQSMYHPQYKKYCPQIVVVNPGFPHHLMNEYKSAIYPRALPSADKSQKHHQTPSQPLVRLDFSDLDELWRKPASDTYKHQRGIVAIAAGCDTSPGAAFLALQMATHSPAGLVHALLDASIQAQASIACPSAIVGTSISDMIALHNPNACVIGCGWGKRSIEELEIFFNLPAHCAFVLDADALHLLPRIYQMPKVKNRLKILTPHLGELRHLARHLKLNTSDALLMAKEVATHYNAVVIAKGATNYIIAPSKRNAQLCIDSHCPALATAGSGDVLAGLVGGIAAHCMSNDTGDVWGRLIRAASVAVLLHTQAGKQLRNGNAQDIIKAISKVYELVGY